MKDKCMRLRAHHGMCLAFFEGKGYSEGFTAHMQSVLERMQENPKLLIIAGEDIICGKCPNLTGEVCNTQELVLRYDKQVLDLCGLAEGEMLHWDEFAQLIEENILAAGKREKICGDCEWTDICKNKGGN